MMKEKLNIKKLLFIVGILIGVIFLYLIISSANFFVLKKIYISGNDLLTIKDILNISGINYNINLSAIDENKIESRLKTHYKVEEADVNIIIPDTIKINIKERIPFACVELDNANYIIDNKAVILDEKNKTYEKNNIFRIVFLYDNENPIKYFMGDKLAIPEIIKVMNNMSSFNEDFSEKINKKIDFVIIEKGSENIRIKFKTHEAVFNFSDYLNDNYELEKALIILNDIIRSNESIEQITISDYSIIGKKHN